MNILITGGAGFIGSHIADAYLAAGHGVTIVDNFSTGRRENLNPGAALAEIDIRDRDAVDGLLAGARFDIVNHHAAQLDVRVSVRDPRFDAEENIIGTLNLLEAARHNGVGRFIFASSGGTVYGEQIVFPADEGHPTDPISPYGVAKLSVEKYLGFYRREHGMRTVVLRYTNVFGPRQNPHGEAGVVAIFIDRLAAGLGVTINGDGAQTRDYVHVADVVRANVMALEYLAGDRSGTFNISTAVETSVNELFGVLNELHGGNCIEEHGPAKPGEQVRSVCSYEHARAVLGWEPAIGVRDGLAQMLRTGGAG